MRSTTYILILLTGFLLTPPTLMAQDSLSYKIKKVQSNFEGPKRLRKFIHNQLKKSTDSLDLRARVGVVETHLSDAGYLEFGLDTFYVKQQTLHLDFHTGSRYFYKSIDLDSLNEVTRLKAGFDKLTRKPDPVDWTDLEERIKWSLNEYQNTGYPFARFDSLDLVYHRKGDSILSDIHYFFDPGRLYLIDSISFTGEKREKDNFIYSLIGLRPGDVYDQQAIDNIPKLMNNSIYFRNVPRTKTRYTEDKAKVDVQLEARKSGKLDLLLGVLPPRDETARLEFTGLADIQLVSPLFRAGEMLSFRFDKLVGTSQKLHLDYMQPYVFATPLRVQGEFDLFKQDTVFLTRYFKFSGYYSFTQSLALKVFYKTKSSSLITTDQYLNISSRPPVLDGKDQTYGLGFLYENLDYRYNPTKGLVVKADFGIGRKKVIVNPKLDEQYYEGLELNIPKREADFTLEWYRSYTRRLVLKLANQTYWLDQKQYFENDLLQVGGSRSIRGFNENEFYTDFYSLFTLENRFLLERNSYLFVFGDYAYLQNQTGTDKILRPWGVGLGMAYETKAGIVSITYAVGQVKDIPFQPSRGRIHVGLVNQF